LGSSRTGRTDRARCAINAIAQRRQPRLDPLGQEGETLVDLDLQLGQQRARLRIQELAIARPLLPLLAENLAERFAPSVN
jgi:hypothetical protein